MAVGLTMRWFGRVAVLALLLGLFAAGWVAASAFQSPEQREAAARPPQPEPVLERVVAGTLADEVQVQAAVGAQVQRSLAPAMLPDPAVVTTSPLSAGDGLEPGDLLLEVSGRPVFVLPGSFAFYRDLKSGLTGPDVEQLQHGLTAAGYEVGEWELGTFGRSTRWAVRRYYEAIGYEALADRPDCEPHGSSGDADEAKGPDDTVSVDDDVVGPPPCEEPGPMVPMSEVVAFNGELPATVASALTVGSQPAAGDALVAVTNGDLVARASVTEQVAMRLSTGMAVELTADDGTIAAATVTSIEAEQTEDASGGGVELVIVPTDVLDVSWAGQEALARITVEVVGEGGLLVPSVAVVSNPQGDTFVSSRADDGSMVKVQVRVVGELAGQSAVVPLEDESLTAGDLVQVG